MRGLTAGFLLVAGMVLSVGPAAAPHATAAEAKATSGADAWRFVWFQGRWWYWLPDNRWVYWQNDCWNRYPCVVTVQTRSSREPAGPVTGAGTGQTMAGGGGTSGTRDEVRPFYGHAESSILYGSSDGQDEIGPFYGRTVPRRSVGFGGSSEDIEPFYGHAGSAYGH